MSEAQVGESAANAAPSPAGLKSHEGTLRLLVKGKNINEKTLLATDYLNHFNEIIMLLEMVPSMPECLEDVQDWAPKSYPAHFRDSGFSDKDLAILAYENAPERFRQPFDAVVAQMDRMIAEGVAAITKSVADTNEALVAQQVTELTEELRRLIDRASAIIHGDERFADQSEIDSIIGQ